VLGRRWGQAGLAVVRAVAFDQRCTGYA